MVSQSVIESCKHIHSFLRSFCIVYCKYTVFLLNKNKSIPNALCDIFYGHWRSMLLQIPFGDDMNWNCQLYLHKQINKRKQAAVQNDTQKYLSYINHLLSKIKHKNHSYTIIELLMYPRNITFVWYDSIDILVLYLLLLNSSTIW